MRSGYSGGYDNEWDQIRWRGAVTSAIRGKRGQAFLRELLEALDAMSEKKLIAGDLEKDGAVCAVGAVCKKRGIDLTKYPLYNDDLDDYLSDSVGSRFAADLGIAKSMVRELFWLNDAATYLLNESPESRYVRVRTYIETAMLKPMQAT